MKGRIPIAITVALVAAAAGTGCSSDDFGPVGGALPLDVSQDSLLVSLDPPLAPLEALDFKPVLQQTPDKREVLYMGSRDAGAWRATPLLRFDFSGGLPDTVVFDATTVNEVRLELEMLRVDKDKGGNRTVRIVALADTLRAADFDAPDLPSLLGAEITQVTRLGSTTFNLPLPLTTVLGWVASGGHTGLALEDLTPQDLPNFEPFNSNFVGFASKELTLLGTLLETNSSLETAIPEIQFEMNDGSFYSFPVLIDLTHFERTKIAADDLTLGSHLASRIWFRFDPESSGVPGNATVNEALLTLNLRRESSLGEQARTVRSYEATRTQALEGSLSDVTQVLRSSDFFETDVDSVLQLDVTDYVQRAVNLVVEPDVGLLVSFDDSRLFLDAADFYGVSAADSLRPRLEISFTPPADFWR